MSSWQKCSQPCTQICMPKYMCTSKDISTYSDSTRTVYNLVCNELICMDSHTSLESLVCFSVHHHISAQKYFTIIFYFLSFCLHLCRPSREINQPLYKDFQGWPHTKSMFWVYTHLIILFADSGPNRKCVLQWQFFAFFKVNWVMYMKKQHPDNRNCL